MSTDRTTAIAAAITAKEALSWRGSYNSEWANPVLWELVCLWEDLAHARERAANSTWSVECERLVERIVLLTVSSGQHADWAGVPMPLLLDGTFQSVHAAIGVDVSVDMGVVRRAHQRVTEGQ